MTLVDNEGFKFVCPFTGTLYDKLHILVINYSNTILTSADKTWKINWSKSTICFIWSQKSSYSSRYLDLYVLAIQSDKKLPYVVCTDINGFQTFDTLLVSINILITIPYIVSFILLFLKSNYITEGKVICNWCLVRMVNLLLCLIFIIRFHFQPIMKRKKL